MTLFVVGSIRTTAPCLATVAQTAPPPTPTAMRSQHAFAGATRIVATTLLVAGSMRETLGPFAFATQTAPGEVAIPSGRGPDRDRRDDAIRPGIDADDGVVRGQHDPDRAVAGRDLSAGVRGRRARLRGLDRDRRDGLARGADPRQLRDGRAHRPDRSLSRRDAAGLRRNRDARDHLAAVRKHLARRRRALPTPRRPPPARTRARHSRG